MEALRIEAELIALHNPLCDLIRSAPKKPAKDVRLPMPFRVRPALKAAIKKAAAQDGRTVSQFTERLLESAMREKGFLK